jgi:hypothetical protein
LDHFVVIILRYYTEAWLVEVAGREAPHVDQEISTERNKCFRRMFGDGPELHKIKKQFGNFSLFAAEFSSFDSIEDRTYLEPKIWWGIHGNSAPELQKLALKLLGQPSSSSCAERNWSTYGLIHSTARNRSSILLKSLFSLFYHILGSWNLSSI